MVQERDHNNLEEFADPHTYDIEDNSDTGIAFYTALAQETGGPGARDRLWHRPRQHPHCAAGFRRDRFGQCVYRRHRHTTMSLRLCTGRRTGAGARAIESKPRSRASRCATLFRRSLRRCCTIRASPSYDSTEIGIWSRSRPRARASSSSAVNAHKERSAWLP